MEVETITEYEIIRLRDNMPLSKLKRITKETMARKGYVDYRGIFETMGYVHAFNNKYFKTKKK